MTTEYLQPQDNDGNDYIYGTKNNDRLYGGQGADTYYYSSGEGLDYISDGSGISTIVLDGVRVENISFQHAPSHLASGEDVLYLQLDGVDIDDAVGSGAIELASNMISNDTGVKLINDEGEQVVKLLDLIKQIHHRDNPGENFKGIEVFVNDTTGSGTAADDYVTFGSSLTSSTAKIGSTYDVVSQLGNDTYVYEPENHNVQIVDRYGNNELVMKGMSISNVIDIEFISHPWGDSERLTADSESIKLTINNMGIESEVSLKYSGSLIFNNASFDISNESGLLCLYEKIKTINGNSAEDRAESSVYEYLYKSKYDIGLDTGVVLKDYGYELVAIGTNGSDVHSDTGDDVPMTIDLGLGDDVYYISSANTKVLEAQEHLGNANGLLNFGGNDSIVVTHSVSSSTGQDPYSDDISNAYIMLDSIENLRHANTVEEGAYIIGNELNNRISGTKYNDVLNGNDGIDKLYGGAGNDVLIGKGLLSGDSGNDVLYAVSDIEYGGSSKLIGGAGDDRIYSSNNGDLLNGGIGHDMLVGDGGDDTLIGGIGADKLEGGIGADVFVFNNINESTLTARDVILDFEVGLDKIDLSKIDAVRNVAGDQSFIEILDADQNFTRYGQLKLEDGVLYGNNRGDLRADFAIKLEAGGERIDALNLNDIIL